MGLCSIRFRPRPQERATVSEVLTEEVGGLLRYYSQIDSQSQRQHRVGPTLKVMYRWRNELSVEFEVGNEIYDETGPFRETHSHRRYVYSGFRWDFR